MEEPSSRWAYSLFAALITAALLWLLGSGFVSIISSTVEAGLELRCGSDTKTLETGQKLRHHPNGCGWVPVEQSESDLTKPYVSPRAYVGPDATVRDTARVLGTADIRGTTVIDGNTIIDSGVRIRSGVVMTATSPPVQ